MNPIGQFELATQNRIIALFHNELDCQYLGDRAEKPANKPINPPSSRRGKRP